MTTFGKCLNRTEAVRNQAETRFYPRGATGGRCHYRGLDWHLVARRPVGPGGWTPYACANNLRQMGLATLNFVDTSGGRFPTGRMVGSDDSLLWSPHVQILPFLEEGGTYKLIHLRNRLAMPRTRRP